jgi:hypothetical protein
MSVSELLTKSTKSFIAIAASVAMAPALAASIEPAAPMPFERVNLVTLFSPCEIDPLGTDVSAANGTITVKLRNQIAAICVPSPPEEPHEIQIGAFPVGRYKLELLREGRTEPLERLEFEVQPLAHTMQYPRDPYPIADYSGLWWAPTDSGWGLSLTQSALGGTLFGTLLVYDTNRQPQWYTLQAGRWTGVTHWRGSVVRTLGPLRTAPGDDTGSATNQVVGEATIDFRRVPFHPYTAELRYSIDGVTVTKTIARIRF